MSFVMIVVTALMASGPGQSNNQVVGYEVRSFDFSSLANCTHARAKMDAYTAGSPLISAECQQK